MESYEMTEQEKKAALKELHGSWTTLSRSVLPLLSKRKRRLLKNYKRLLEVFHQRAKEKRLSLTA
jgi:hypothetical protein